MVGIDEKRQTATELSQYPKFSLWKCGSCHTEFTLTPKPEYCWNCGQKFAKWERKET